jgi:hypothetical protein
VPSPPEADLDELEPEQLVLSDLLNRVLDKGVVISANVTISIADIDLIQLDLRLLISSFATLARRAGEGRTAGEVRESRAELPVRTDSER